MTAVAFFIEQEGNPPPPRIHWKPEAPTHDYCETCGIRLYPSERVEVTGTFEVHDEAPGMGGLGGITATYCTEHAPQEATT